MHFYDAMHHVYYYMMDHAYYALCVFMMSYM